MFYELILITERVFVDSTAFKYISWKPRNLSCLKGSSLSSNKYLHLHRYLEEWEEEPKRSHQIHRKSITCHEECNFVEIIVRQKWILELLEFTFLVQLDPSCLKPLKSHTWQPTVLLYLLFHFSLPRSQSINSLYLFFIYD